MASTSSSDSEAFDMNTLLRGEVQDARAREGEEGAEVESIGGKADGGAGQDRSETGSTDMNTWLRGAVSESRGRGV